MARDTALLIVFAALLATLGCSSQDPGAAAQTQGEGMRAPQWHEHAEPAQTGIDPPGVAARAQAEQVARVEARDAAASEAMSPDAGFDPASVPQTQVELPPFPFFKVPDGLHSALADNDKHVSFDGQYFIAGDRPVLVEGRIFHDKFKLKHAGRSYSEREFLRNYENAITALGGRRINTAQYTPTSIAAAGGRDKLEKNAYGAPVAPGYPRDAYLIRTVDKEYWIEVSVGVIPAAGFLVVLERKAVQ